MVVLFLPLSQPSHPRTHAPPAKSSSSLTSFLKPLKKRRKTESDQEMTTSRSFHETEITIQKENESVLDEKPFICEECGVAFTTEPEYQSHIRLHNRMKPFNCVHCGKTFNLECTLKSHLRRHTGEKPFKCNECGKAFMHDSTLQSHYAEHDKNSE